jgi:sec-independent protein translocase protein TatC
MALRFRRRRLRDPAGTMTVVEHLDELRRRLFICLGALVVCGFAAWFLYDPVYRFLTNPYCSFMVQHPDLAQNPAKPCELVFMAIPEAFLVKIKTVAAMAFVLALPVVLFKFWWFVTPGLTNRERRYALPFVFASLLLFALGAVFALWTLPKALGFLLGFAGTTRVAALLTIGKYLSFVTLIMLAFGASFEFPVVLVSLTMVGVLSSRQLRDWRRWALLLIAVFAAVITPSQDWFTMTAMMVPLLVFYELSILIARLLKK